MTGAYAPTSLNATITGLKSPLQTLGQARLCLMNVGIVSICLSLSALAREESETIMKIKTSELTGPALDWAVAKCEGYIGISLQERTGTDWYSPSTDWSQGGPIIERENIAIRPFKDGGEWLAKSATKQCDGQTPLIAAMRCYVASKLGDTVEIPHELAF